MKLIAEGALDESEAGVEALAERLGVGGRQLRRLFQQHLGASPIAVAQTRRVLFAKHLIHDTRLPMTEVALSAGLRQRAPLQRDLPQDVRPPAQRAAPQGRPRQFGARRRDPAAQLPPALRLAGHAGRAGPARQQAAGMDRRRAVASPDRARRQDRHGRGRASAGAQCRRGHHPLPRRARSCRRSSRG
jgi:AraC-like DNA-binding protein